MAEFSSFKLLCQGAGAGEKKKASDLSQLQSATDTRHSNKQQQNILKKLVKMKYDCYMTFEQCCCKTL